MDQRTGPGDPLSLTVLTGAVRGEARSPDVQERIISTWPLVTGRDEAGGDETVKVAHETLFTNWGRLRGWLDEVREFLLW